jgi:hypothetical protein
MIYQVTLMMLAGAGVDEIVNYATAPSLMRSI